MFDPFELIGQRFAGKLEVASVEAETPTSAILRARDTILMRDVALKLLLPSDTASLETGVARLYREAMALARLAHGNAPMIFEAGQDAATGLHFVVREWIPGQRLADLMTRPMSEAQVLRIAHDVAAALATAHRQGILHRDLRADNVIVTTDLDGQPVAKVLDFNVAAFDETYDLARLTAPDEVVGAFAYISPEQAQGHPVSARTDVYAFGVMLYHMLCGQLPFSGTPVQILNAHQRKERPRIRPRTGLELSPLLKALTRRCLHANPDERFKDCAALYDVLDNVERERGSMQRRAIHSVTTDARARRLIVGRGDGSIDVYDGPSGERQMRFDGHRGPIKALALRPESDEFLSAGDDGQIHMWNIAQQQRTGTWPGLRGQQFTLAFSPFGYIFATGEADGRIRLWSLVEQGPLGELRAHEGAVSALHFLPDGRFLASGGADGTLALWDIGAMELAGQCQWSLGPVTHLAMHVQERFVAAFEDGSLAMGRWRRPDGPMWHQRVHEKRVSRLFEQAGGQGVFSVGLDGAIHCIDVFDGQPRREPVQHVGGIHAACLHAPSERLYASSDSMLLCWSWTPAGTPALEGFLSDERGSGWQHL